MPTEQNVPVGRTAAEILNSTPHGPMCPQKSSTGFCNCDHKVRAIQSVLDREAGLRAIADKLVNSGCECDPAYSTHQCLSCQARAALTPVPIEAGEVVHMISVGDDGRLKIDGNNAFEPTPSASSEVDR